MDFTELKAAAQRLNRVSDVLAKSVVDLDAQLKELHLGIPAWVLLEHVTNKGTGDSRRHELGYAKVGGKWGVAIKTTSMNLNESADSMQDERWLFADSPRQLRMLAIGRLPLLLEALTKAADELTAEIQKRLGEK